MIGVKTSEAGRDLLEQYQICVDDACAVVVNGTDHVHEFVPAIEYFCD